MHPHALLYPSTRSHRVGRRPPPSRVAARRSRGVFLAGTTQQVRSASRTAEIARATLALMNVVVWAGLLWVL